jgi:hypothetical protein
MDRVAAASFKTHLRAAFTAALLLGLCQIVIETLVIAVRFRHFIVSPHEFGRTQMYDYCVKLFALLPQTAHWLDGGALDRFLSDGFNAKLGLAAGLVVPNLVAGGVLVLLIAAAGALLRRPSSVVGSLSTLVVLGMAVHGLSFLLAVHIPHSWRIRTVLRNSARMFLFDGTWIAVCVLAAAAVVAVLIARRRSSMSWAALVVVAAGGIAIAALLPHRPASSAPTAVGMHRDTTGTPLRVANVVLISIDSLRADRLGCYGEAHDTSPTIDRLAREGVRFANATSPTSWTLPSHMSMLTGRYLLSHGVISETDRLNQSVPTLAEALRASGLATGGVVSTLFLHPRYGFARGFDYYDDSSISGITNFDLLRAEPAPEVTRLAINWLRQQQNRRFFLFLHFWDVHMDYIPPSPYDQMFDPGYRGSIDGSNFRYNPAVNPRMAQRDLDHVLALYDGEIRWVDDHIAKVLAALDEMGVGDRTAVIVTADHGDEFFEHGGKGHGRTLYREVVHVPLIMRIPGVTPGKVVRMPVSLVDIMPTVLDLVGARAPVGLQGVSLVPELTGADGDMRRTVYAWLCNPSTRIDCEAMEHSGIDTLIDILQSPRIELYAADDVVQRTNLARAAGWPRHQRLMALTDELNAHWEAFRSGGGRLGGVQIDKATMERLRALGYAD